ncbi:MAG: hypothetical protein U0359_11660 [Byssovorax sp.]
MTLLTRSIALLSALAAVIGGCAVSNGTGPSGTGGGGGGTTTASTTTTGATTSAGAGGMGGEGGTVFTGSGGSGGGEPDQVVVYIHTNKTLYSLDPKAADLGLKVVGNFDCIGGAGQDTAMTDLAVNDQGELWGISATSVYKLVVQGSTVHCASTTVLSNAQMVQFYALTFAPPGVIDPAKEVLVAGNTAGELWAIDANGNLTLHGNFGNVPASDGNGHSYPKANQGKRWELSGDIVFLAHNGNPLGFATVRDCPNPPVNSSCNPVDTLIEIDMSKLKGASNQSITKTVRGQIVKKPGCADPSGQDGYGSMYGIAAWSDKIYGTSHSGAIVEIDNGTGAACLVKDMPMTFWNGAGVTTLAPVIDPPPK